MFLTCFYCGSVIGCGLVFCSECEDECDRDSGAYGVEYGGVCESCHKELIADASEVT